MVDYNKLPKRNIIVIDMKSFYATCECVERGLDPYTTPLVVAEPNRNGAITLAVTPYMKSLGVGSRTRIYAIPPTTNNMIPLVSNFSANGLKAKIITHPMAKYSIIDNFLNFEYFFNAFIPKETLIKTMEMVFTAHMQKLELLSSSHPRI